MGRINSYQQLSRRLIKVSLSVSLVAFLNTIMPTTVSAKDYAYEEILVTANKRTESLQDVPISMSVVSGEKISEAGIRELEELSMHIPSLHVAEAGAGAQIFIRGIGSGVNNGFEQSVGTFIDGVYFGRSRNARAAFLDLERVEVLKGPQSTIFGKNTIAGAINLTTARPIEELEGYIEGSYVDQTSGAGVTAMVSGAISNTVLGRVVVMSFKDDGFVEDANGIGEDGPQADNQLIRGTFVWNASDELVLTVKVEDGQFDVVGRSDMIAIASPTATALYQALGDPDFQAGFGYKKSTANVINPIIGNNGGEFDNTDSSIYQLTVDYEWGEFILSSITAYTEYQFENYLDKDSGPIRMIGGSRNEKHTQLSQEILLTSPSTESFEYITGIYYQTNDLEADSTTDLALSSLGPVENIIFGQVEAGFALPLGFLNSGDLDGTAIDHFEQDTTTFSAFAEGTWYVEETLRIKLGLRYSYEEKEIFKNQIIAPLFGTAPDAFLALVYEFGLAVSAPYVFDENTPGFENERDEDHWTGSLNISYDMTDEIMTYFTLSNGFKAGGYDASNRMGNVEAEAFDDESVEHIEIGVKTDFWDSRARVNFTLFNSVFENLQVSTFDGNCCFNVGNAAESEVKGVETDFRLLLTEEFTFIGSLAYLDASYNEFTDAACNARQSAAFIGPGGCTQDLSGKPLQFAPDWSGNFGLEYLAGINDHLEIRAAIDVNYSDDVVIANDLDENLIQDSFYKFNARIRLASTEGKWSVALIGKNLNNEKTLKWGNDVALNSLGFADTYFKYIDPPRTVEIQARYNFW